MKGVQRNSRMTSAVQGNSQRYKSKSEKRCLWAILVTWSYFSNQDLHKAHETVLISREFSNMSVGLLLFRPTLLNTSFFFALLHSPNRPVSNLYLQFLTWTLKCHFYLIPIFTSSISLITPGLAQTLFSDKLFAELPRKSKYVDPWYGINLVLCHPIK